jgi:hypothetical protein
MAASNELPPFPALRYLKDRAAATILEGVNQSKTE